MAAGITTCPACQMAFNNTHAIDWSRNPLNPSNLTSAISRVRQVVRDGKYDIVHVHTPIASFVVRYALRNWSRQDRPVVIYTAHGFHFHRNGSPLKNIAFLALEKLAGRWTDYLVVINHEDKYAAVSNGIVRPEQVQYMPGIGIDLRHYLALDNNPSSLEKTRLELGVKPQQILLLMVASFDPEKRHRDMLQAIALLKRHDFVLAFAGVGPLKQRSMALANSLCVMDKVRFLGFREDIPALLKASLATILPSEREGLPRSVMESMALGIPVIGADTRGTRDLLASGGGLLVPIGDITGFAQAIAYLLDQPERAVQMGEQGRSSIRQYDINHILYLHEQLYSHALSMSITTT
jgi:glycosyltransferase involved in cell wall biosynthesis